MNFSIIKNVFVINLDMTFTTAMASILVLVGYAIKSKIKFLQKYCIPAPVIGGFLFMLITATGHFSNVFSFKFDTTLQSFFMLMFFTTVGLGANLNILKKGGVLLIIYWLIAGFISVIQNIIGVSIGKAVGTPIPYALLSSAISMIGGHGAGLAYGKTFEEMGYPSGQLVGAAAATFGLISSVIIGGPIASRLIRKHKLEPGDQDNFEDTLGNINGISDKKLTSIDVAKNITAILICMAFGTIISEWIGKIIHMQFPVYVGAMFVAVILRNLNEAFHFYNFDFKLVNGVGDISLNIYLSIAMMSLRLWEFVDLAGGMLIILFCQVLFISIFAYFIVFKILGSDYDAAVMCAGLIGHSLGATPTAIVNLSSVNDKYGMSRKAMMIVPIVGAFLVDIIYQPQTIWFIKTFIK